MTKGQFYGIKAGNVELGIRARVSDSKQSSRKKLAKAMRKSKVSRKKKLKGGKR